MSRTHHVAIFLACVMQNWGIKGWKLEVDSCRNTWGSNEEENCGGSGSDGMMCGVCG